jgi:protoporphyrinogen oxidase
MKIAVIGGGFTGLAAASKLISSGHEVEIFEKDHLPGGLAIGFKDQSWDWQLEKHYHHLFTSDTAILKLARLVNHQLNFYRPVTATWINQGLFPLDSPLNLLKFPGLPVTDRLRTGIVLAFLKLTPFWRPLENITTETFIRYSMGQKSWQVLWEPLMSQKFGQDSGNISAVWFWARVFKRSPSLGYPAGGFQSLAQSIADYISKSGGKIHFGVGVKSISDSMEVTTQLGDKCQFDRVICTLPSSLFVKTAPKLPESYRHQQNSLQGIGAVNLVLSLKKSFLPNNIYWLNINVPGTPFLCVVEHTHLISPSHYQNQHLLYVGNYQNQRHNYFNLTADELFKLFLPHLKKINPDFTPGWVRSKWVWKAPFAQPIIPVNYSKYIPDVKTPIKNLFLANIQQVYPWDRGTNYAVELGLKAATLCLKK